MKKILILMIAIGLSFTGCSNTKPSAKKGPWDIDTRKTVSPMKNGLKNGVEKVYYQNGMLAWSVPYVNGKKNGKQYYYSQANNGKLMFITPYKNGIQEGVEFAFYESGNISEIKPYKNGKLNGLYMFYENNGKLTEKKPYVNGRRTDTIDPHEIHQYYTDQSCRDYPSNPMFLLDANGKAIQGRAKREMWYRSNCGKFINK